MVDFLLTLVWLSLAGSVLGLVLMGIKALSGGRSGKQFYYLLWIIVLLRMCLPVSGLTSYTDNDDASYSSAAGFVRSWRETGELLSASEDAAPVQNFLTSVSTAEPAVTGEAAQENLRENTSGTVAGDRRSLGSLRSAPGLWFSLWAVGAAASLLWFVCGYVRLCQWVKMGKTEPDGEMKKAFYRLYSGKRLRLIASKNAGTPMLMGMVHPKIVVPARFFSTEDGENILRHELSHYRRLDILYKWFSMLCACVHWFNPLMIVFCREIGAACELACDENVIRHMDETRRRRYGETLITLSASCRMPASVLATSMASGKKQMKGRLLSIMNYKRKSALAAIVSVLLTLTLCACAGLSGPPVDHMVPDGAAQNGTEHNHDTDMSGTEETTPLTAGELGWFQNEFFSGFNTDADGELNIRNMFLVSEYTVPEDVDLYDTFYHSGSTDFTQEERDALKAKWGENAFKISPVYKMTAGDMDALLRENTGLTLAQTNRVKLETFTYLPEFDMYCQSHGDLLYIVPDIASGVKNETGEVWLTYDVILSYASERTVHLTPDGRGSYFFVSNTENPSTGLEILSGQLHYDPAGDVLEVRIPTLGTKLAWSISFDGRLKTEEGGRNVRPLSGLTEWEENKYYAFGNVSKYTDLTMTASLPDKITGEREYAETDILDWLEKNGWFADRPPDGQEENVLQGTVSGIYDAINAINVTAADYSPYWEVTVYLPEGMSTGAALGDHVTVVYTGTPGYMFDADGNVVYHWIEGLQIQSVAVDAPA